MPKHRNTFLQESASSKARSLEHSPRRDVRWYVQKWDGLMWLDLVFTFSGYMSAYAHMIELERELADGNPIVNQGNTQCFRVMHQVRIDGIPVDGGQYQSADDQYHFDLLA